MAVWQASATQLAPPTQTLLSQTWSAGQVPQSIMPKQPLPIVPQYRPLGGLQVTDGVQVPASVAIDRSGAFGRVSVTVGASGPPVVVALSTPPPSGFCCEDVGVTPAHAAAPRAKTNTSTVRTGGLQDMVHSSLSGR